MWKINYIHNCIFAPNDLQLFSRINAACDELHLKFKHLDLKGLGISEYNQRYIGSYLANPIGTFQLYGYLVALSIVQYNGPLKEFTLLDYGGGCGILSLLAKESGIGRVIYNDIYDRSCEDIKILAQATGIEIDDFICGDIDAVITNLRKRSIPVNAVSSYDVIEHIYCVEGYLRKLRFLSNHRLRIVIASDANGENPIIYRRIKKRHLRYEYSKRVREWGCKERDTLMSYMDARKEIISAYDPTLGSEVIEELALRTRGLMKQDIEKNVDEYNSAGGISYCINHPTNTCDPYTGSWEEQLIRLEWLENILGEEGYKVKILAGYYYYTPSLFKRLLKNLLNIGVKHLGRTGLYLSPYYVVIADKH
jgi:2-polyprenyl-3-methyl-5-hydroxy-6-metoxy-1,4-benzoquinol methylase